MGKFLATLFACVLLISSGCRSSSDTSVATPGLAQMQVGGTVLHLEVASTNADRSRGLMYRKEMPRDHGMIFVFPEASDHEFWMKNTPLPLDMIFVDEKFVVVGVAENTTPFSTAHVGVGRPSKYVIETNAGVAAALGIVTGTILQITGF